MTYNGGFKNGLFEGENCSYASATSRYVGKFVQGKKEGMGKFSNEVGTQSGNFHNDELNGLGTFEWKDGKLYEGEFQRSKFHGKGKITYKNKQVAEGIWEDGHNKILNSVAVKK